eukprot:TRINITY_DN74722_c0_g1_i1.p1 TRINITY_DN74722_c0_g1~~TRINITY_DN74722_c0_g1_i1.p1  ORF type:complete len:132 (+),score=36.73 TRINITY_DN74722_c0_g1_i1:75-470(+)
MACRSCFVGCLRLLGLAKQPLLPSTVSRLQVFFARMDIDGNNEITRDEAVQFWGKNFAKVNANAMFAEVDEDKDSSITLKEFMGFWQQVKDSGYTDQDILEEIEAMLDGGAWVDWKDTRSTDATPSHKKKT